MPLNRIVLFALCLMAGAGSCAAFGMGAGAGCADLPEYYRAVGALEGMPGACDMTVEQARRIVAAEQGGQQQVPAMGPAVRYRRHRHNFTRSMRVPRE